MKFYVSALVGVIIKVVVVVISNFYVVTVNKQPNNVCMGFFRHYSISSRSPKCPGSYPWGYAYPRFGIAGQGD